MHVVAVGADQPKRAAYSAKLDRACTTDNKPDSDSRLFVVVTARLQLGIDVLHLYNFHLENEECLELRSQVYGKPCKLAETT